MITNILSDSEEFSGFVLEKSKGQFGIPTVDVRFPDPNDWRQANLIGGSNQVTAPTIEEATEKAKDLILSGNI